jgi:hypothetical protein
MMTRGARASSGSAIRGHVAANRVGRVHPRTPLDAIDAAPPLNLEARRVARLPMRP